MILKELFSKQLPVIPVEIREKINRPNAIALTDFSDKDRILCHPQLHSQAGFRRFPDGSYLVSMYCPMPGITPEMIKWWFWWHPQADERYQVWFPGEHYGISFDRKNSAYFAQTALPAFQPNTHYPTERIGGARLPLRIDFVSAEDFGFSAQAMEENQIPMIVCGHVSAFRGLVPHTEMAHIFRRTDDGLFLISRFWLGRTLKNPLLRRAILTEETARGMAEHCCVEYRNLAEILPDLYNRYAKQGKAFSGR